MKSVDAKLTALKERIKALDTQIKRTENAAEKALKIETKELRRRLGELNGEAGRIKSAQDASVSREKFDQYREDQNQKQVAKDHEIDRRLDEITNTRIRPLEDFKQNFQGRVAMLGIVWGVIVIVVSWYLSKH